MNGRTLMVATTALMLLGAAATRPALAHNDWGCRSSAAWSAAMR
ncbi:MAG: hypothetical protein R3D25_11260 [Geminicoccaceae bacterium]